MPAVGFAEGVAPEVGDGVEEQPNEDALDSTAAELLVLFAQTVPGAAS